MQKKVKRYYCTYFDRNYLLKALVLFASLARRSPGPIQVYAVCMDEISRVLLRKLAIPGVVPVALHTIEELDEPLLKAKRSRNLVEYYWTTTSTILLHLLDANSEIDTLTYLDADLYFYSSPEPVFAEFGDKSILIHEHRFPTALKHLEANGRFNVGMMCFRNDRTALSALKWWRDRCLEWCYDRSENGKMGDQGYLNDWPTRFENVHVLENIGAGVAPWNQSQYRFTRPSAESVLVNSTPLVFYHFHGLEFVNSSAVLPIKHPVYPLTSDILHCCFLPYAEALIDALASVRRVMPDFSFGLCGDQAIRPQQTFIAEKSGLDTFARFQGSHRLVDLNERWSCFASAQLVGTAGDRVKPAAERRPLEGSVTLSRTSPLKEPLVSAIVSTFNSERYIRGCLRDLIGQTLFQKGRLEIIVVDSGSEENERSVVEEFQRSHQGITYLRTERETVYSAWNRGVELARGRYVTNANTDDAHRPDALETLASALENHPDAYLAYGDFITTAVPNGSFANPQAGRRVVFPPYEPATLMLYCVTGCHPMWRRNVFDTIGLFDPTLKSAGDYEFVLRLAKAGLIAVHVPEILSLYFQNPKGIQFGAWQESSQESDQVRARYRADMPIDRLYRINRADPESVVQGWLTLGNLALKHQIPWFEGFRSDCDYADFCYLNALGAFPRNPAALHNLAVLRWIQGRKEQSAQMLEQLPAEYAAELAGDLEKEKYNIIGFDVGPGLTATTAGNKPAQTQAADDTERAGFQGKQESKAGAEPSKTGSAPVLSEGVSQTPAPRLEVVGAKFLVSAIVSTYNAELFMRGCLQDLVEQTIFQKRQLEILVVDSGSQENERSIVEEFQRRHPNIRYERTERETLYAAWNRAIKMARGKYLTPANTDDRHRRDALEVMARALDEKGVGMVYSDVLLTSGANETFDQNSAQRVWRLPDYTLRQALMSCLFGSKDMWRRDLHEQVGYFDPTYSIAGDYEFFLRLVQKHGAFHIPDTLGLYFESQKNLSYGDPAKVVQEVFRFIGHFRNTIPLEDIYPFLREDRTNLARAAALVDWANQLAWFAAYPGLEESKRFYNEALELKSEHSAGIQNNLALLYCRQGRSEEAFQLLKESARTSPIAQHNLTATQSDGSNAQIRLFGIPFPAIENLPKMLKPTEERIPLVEYLKEKSRKQDASPSTSLTRDYPNGQQQAAGGGAGTPHSLLWLGAIYDPSGYADEARNFVVNLKQRGCDIAIRSIGRNSREFRDRMDADTRQILDGLLRKPVSPPFICVIHGPGYSFERSDEAAYCIGRTMFETDRLPPNWVERCNRMDEIWVPSQLALEGFRNAGVQTRIAKIPEGVDTSRFRPGLEPLAIPGARKKVFLSIFEWIYRKGWDVLLSAWARTFKSTDDVCLVLRSYPGNGADKPDAQALIEARINDCLKHGLGVGREQVAPIIVLGGQISESDMPRLYAAADAYVSPSRGEGWGRTPMEAMACGLPTISTRWGGTQEFMNDRNSLLIDYSMVEVDERCEIDFYRGHRWAEPSVEHLEILLRRVVDEPSAMTALGLRAREDIVKQWQWHRVAGIVEDRLREIERELPRGRPTPASGSAVPGFRLPSPPQGSLVPVLWHGLFYSMSGYAEEARHFVLNLDPKRINLAIRPFAPPSELCRNQLDPKERGKLDSLLAKTFEPPFIGVVHASGRCLERLPGAAYCIGRTMFETDRLPQDWVEKCNRMDEIWVPTEHSLESFRNSRVTARLVKIPGGVDTDRFRPGLNPLPLTGKRKTVFLSIFEWSYRKGWDVLLHAWARAFKPQDDVCLVLRAHPLNASEAPDVSPEINLFIDAFLNRILKLSRADVAPILVLGKPIPEVDLPRLYGAANAYVAPSRGEGWGRPQMDAMACGLPVIATGWGGTREFMTEHNSLLLDYIMADIGKESEIEYFRGHKWAEPSREHLVRLLRRVAEQPEEVAKVGARARQDMVESWTWSHASELAAARLQEIGQELAGQGRLPSYKRESVHSMNDPSRKPDASGPSQDPGPDRASVHPEVLRLLEKADAEYRKGNLAEARSILLEALRITPDSPRILATLGAISFALNDFKAAKEQFAKAAALAPNDPGVRVQLALANLEMDQIDEFESALASALALDPNYRDALKLLADLNLKQGAFKDAAQTYTKIVTHNPEDLDSLLGLGACFYKSNDLETAGQVYQRILHLSPGHSLATKNLAAIKEQLNAGIADKIRELSAAIQIGGSLGGTGAAVANLPAQEDFSGLLERADKDYRDGNFAAARKNLEQALRMAPANAVVMERLGQAAFALGDFASAHAQFSRLAQIKPSEPSVFVQLARIHLKLDQIAEFEVALGRALELDPFHRDALGLLAELNLRNERYQDAAQTFTKILSRYPDDLEALLPLGVCFFRLDDIETAKIVFERVLQKHPGNAMAQENLEIIRQKLPDAGRSVSDGGISDFRLGKPEMGGPPVGTLDPKITDSAAHPPAPVANSERDVLLTQAEAARQQGNLPKARQHFLEALRRSPDEPKILTVLGEVCYGLNEFEEAYRHLLRATEVHRTDPAIFLQFALVNLKLDQIEEFEVALGRALEIDPNYREALKVLADLNYQNGRTKDAAQAYTRILSRHPDDLEALLPLGVCFFKEGDFETARLVFERALERHPGNEIAKDNLAAIREKIAGQSLGISQPSASSVPAAEQGRKPSASAAGNSKSAPLAKPTGEAAPNPKSPGSGSDDAATRASLLNLMDQANFFCEVGNREAALESLQEAAELAPRDAQIRSALGSLHLTLGNYESAREQFRRLIEIKPRDVDGYTRLAMACVKLDRIEEMEAALGLALEIDPDHREALKFLAKTNIENNRVRDAGRAYAKLLEKQPDDVESLLSLGLCFFRGGDLESARMVYSRVLEVDPNNLTARDNLFQLDEYAQDRFTGNPKAPVPVPAPSPPPLPQAKQPADEFSNLNRALAKADAAFGAQNLAEARDALKTALEFAPGSPEILSALSTVCFQLGDVRETRGYLQQLVGVVPTDPQKWVQLALSHYQLGDIAEYETALSRALVLDPSHLEALRLQAQVDFNRGKIQEAARTFGKMLKQTPDDIEVLMPLGVCFFKVGDFETAQTVFERLLEIDPHNALAVENLKSTQDKLAAQSKLTSAAPIVPKPDATIQPGVPVTEAKPSVPRPGLARSVSESVSQANTLWAAGDLRGAATALREALNSEPDSHEMRATLGSLLFQLGELNAGHEELAHAARLHPDSADYLTRLALALLGLQRVAEFESALGRALEVDPNHRPALRVLADLNFREGRFQDAANTYHKILLQAPDDIETMLPLAVCFFKTGDADAAKMVFERVLAIDPQNSVARENLGVLTHPGGATPQNKSVQPAEAKPRPKKKR